MHISCPHCNAAYEVGPMIKNAVLVCHRCHAEFSMDDELIEGQQKGTLEETGQSLPLFDHIKSDHIKPDQPASQDEDAQEVEQDVEGQSLEESNPESEPKSEQSVEQPDKAPLPAFLDGDHEYAEKIKLEEASTQSDPIDSLEEESGPEKNVPSDDSDPEETHTPLNELKESLLPPARKIGAIWPWLIAMLLIISATGFWFKQDVWLDNPWVRSVLINMHLPVEVRNKDWYIIPGSVQGNWLKRDDGSQVLTVQGRIENRLYCELPPPRIFVRFFDDTGITESLGDKLLPITEPPSMEQVKHAPFITPEIDLVPVEAQGERGFFLVIDSLPEHTADFTLSPAINGKQ
ncbi:MAG: hypothetical protein ABUK11_09200 [Mariprofundaceae bacterium]